MRQVEVGVEQLELARVQGAREAGAADVPGQDRDGEDRAAQVEAHLDGVGPDDRLDAAEVGVHDGDHGEHDDDEAVARVHAELVEQQLDGDRGGEQPDALGEEPGEDEGDRGQPLEFQPESGPQVLVGADEAAPLVQGDEDGGDDDAADDVAEGQFDVAEALSAVGAAGHADDGEHAGLGGDHGERHRPPRHAALADEVVLRRRLPAGQAQSDHGDRHQVDDDHHEVELAHALS